MNPNNYTTLEQSKRLKELGIQQEVSDCVWIKIAGKWLPEPVPRKDCSIDMIRYYTIEAEDEVIAYIVDKWYAAFNLQEIFVSGDNFNIINIQGYFYIRTRDMVLIGRADEAQAMADAKIWELENKK
jgi:hypothetical protein